MTLLGKILRKILGSVLLVHENDNLVIVDLIEELTEHRDFLIFLDLNVELFKTVQHKLGVITNEDFELLRKKINRIYFLKFHKKNNLHLRGIWHKSSCSHRTWYH